MRHLVTGGAGFIGSAVCRQLVRAGHEVVNLDALTYAADLRSLDEVGDSPLYASSTPTSPTPTPWPASSPSTGPTG